MKIAARQVLLTVLVLAGALAMTKALFAWPNLLPSGLRTLGNLIVETVGADSAESSSDIELAYVFLISLLATFLAFSGLKWLIKHMQKT